MLNAAGVQGVLDEIGVSRNRRASSVASGPANEAQLRIAQRGDRSRTRRTIDHGQFVNDGPGPKIARIEDRRAGRRRYLLCKHADGFPIARSNPF